MHILTGILLFVIGSIAAAMNGDWSGMEAIGKILLFIVMFFVMAYLIIYPELLLVAIAILVLIVIACSGK